MPGLTVSYLIHGGFGPAAGFESRPMHEMNPNLARAATAAAAISALAACGGGGGGGDDGPPANLDAVQAARFLSHASLGASRPQIAEVQQLGFERWLERQFTMPSDMGHFDWLTVQGFGVEANRHNTAGLDATLWRKFIGGQDALRQRMTLALSEILVASVTGISTVYRQFCIAHYVDLLEAHAFGNYRTLLRQVTLSTAMGYFLTYRGNAKANGRGSQPDENYARELMQLFTLGLVELQPDGAPKPGAPETYGPADVSGLARVFTGWDVNASGSSSTWPPDVHRSPMVQVASRHETGAKTFLGTTIPAGTPAAAALDTALDTVFNHPNVPPFVSRQLIQRLVTSNPSGPYVARVAGVFANNGQGVRGDLKAVLRAILLDPEARNAPASASFGKLREPVVRFLNWARGFGASSPSGAWAIGDLSDPASRLGQSPMRSPSVFNFFRPGYVPPGGAIAQAGLAAPEFQITTETSVAGYLNFMQSAIAGNSVGDVRADPSSLLALVADVPALLAELNLVLAAGQLGAGTLATIKAALEAVPIASDAGRRNRVQAAILLVMASPDYIAQK
jgi:uncharacterized protein (DUF1800 family)